MDAIGGEINRAVTTLTTKEYVYRAWVKKYWGSDAVKPFNEVMAAVKSVDDAIHAFNDPGKEKEKTTELEKRLGILRAEIDQWLVHYSRNQSLNLPAVAVVAGRQTHHQFNLRCAAIRRPVARRAEYGPVMPSIVRSFTADQTTV